MLEWSMSEFLILFLQNNLNIKRNTDSSLNIVVLKRKLIFDGLYACLQYYKQSYTLPMKIPILN